MTKALLAGPLEARPGAYFQAQLLRSWASALADLGVVCYLAQYGQLEYWMRQSVLPHNSSAYYFTRRHLDLGGSLVERAETRLLATTARLQQPDFTVIVPTWPINPRDRVSELREAGAGTLISWLGVPPRHAARNGRTIDFLRCMDIVAAYDPTNASELRASGVSDVRILPLAADVEAIRRAIGDPRNLERPIPLGFCGRVDLYREEQLGLLLELGLHMWTDSDLRSAALRRVASPAVSGARLYEVLGGCRVGVNIHRPEEVYGGNARTFEIPACGAALLCDRLPGPESHFADGKEAIFFDSPADMREKAETLLMGEGTAKAVGIAGYRRIVSEHTTGDRMRQLLSWNNLAPD